MLKRKSTRNKAKRTVKTASRARLAGNGEWSRARLVVVGVLFAGLWVCLWGRAWYVQVYKGSELAQMAHRQHEATELVSGRRGEILDRNGLVLARSVANKSVFARPLEVKDVYGTATQLAQILGVDAKNLRKRLGTRKSFTWVSRKVGDKAAAAIRNSKLQGVYLTTEYSRLYPNRQLAGKLFGFVGLDDKGLEGLERSFEDHLTGESTKQVVQRDAAGRRLYLHGAERDPSLEGKDLHLTLDSQVQFFAEDALAKAVEQYEGSWGGAVVVEVASGDILAWAEYPYFNPNAYRTYKPSQWRNRIATDALEMGSTIKPFLVAAALEEGKVQPDSLYYCENGKWKLHSVRIKDTHEYEWLPVSKVVRYSSNIGSAKIGLDLGAKTYHGYLERLGFGQRTGVPVGGESKGILRAPNQWRDVDTAAASFGQGFSATLLQMAQAYVTLANDGVRKPLRIVKAPASELAPEVRVFSEKTARTVRDMLRDVVEEDGTGTQAHIDGMEVGGKTGTAQKASSAGGYGSEYLASFAGMVPIDKPEFVIVVAVDDPKKNHYGGVVAAPAFRSVAMQTLAYKGTLPDYVADRIETVAASGGKSRLSGTNTLRRDVKHTLATAGKTIPDVRGKSLRRAVEAYAMHGIIPVVQGSGMIVTKQDPPAGATWSKQEKQQYIIWVSEQS